MSIIKEGITGRVVLALLAVYIVWVQPVLLSV